MTDRLTTDQMMQDTLLQNRLGGVFERLQNYAEIHEKVKVFEAVVWFPRLQALVNATKSRGMSGRCRDIQVMTWCCAGRCLIQLQRKGSRLTLVTADDEKPWTRDMCHMAPGMGPMGIQGIDSTPLDALVMLYEVTRYGREITLKDDDDVSIS